MAVCSSALLSPGPPLTALHQLQRTAGQRRAACEHAQRSARVALRAQVRALHRKAAKAEKVKTEKGGHMMWTEVGELGQMIRRGDMTWEDLALDDIDIRLKWAGLFHRRKRAPGTFMMRLKVCKSVFPGPATVVRMVFQQRASLRASRWHPGNRGDQQVCMWVMYFIHPFPLVTSRRGGS